MFIIDVNYDYEHVSKMGDFQIYQKVSFYPYYRCFTEISRERSKIKRGEVVIFDNIENQVESLPTMGKTT